MHATFERYTLITSAGNGSKMLNETVALCYRVMSRDKSPQGFVLKYMCTMAILYFGLLFNVSCHTMNIGERQHEEKSCKQPYACDI